MHICKARATDRAEWLRLRQTLFPDEAPESWTDEFESYLQNPDIGLFVAERQNGKLAGFIYVGLRNYAEDCETSPVAFIEELFVDADMRRQGLGKALVATAEAWAKARDLREIASDTWLENELSIQAHQALGYEEVVRLVCFKKELG